MCLAAGLLNTPYNHHRQMPAPTSPLSQGGPQRRPRQVTQTSAGPGQVFFHQRSVLELCVVTLGFIQLWPEAGPSHRPQEMPSHTEGRKCELLYKVNGKLTSTLPPALSPASFSQTPLQEVVLFTGWNESTHPTNAG